MKTDNELIAEFMDGTVFDESGQCTNPERKYSWRPGVYDPLRVEHLQYDTSWSWLMPVVEKIESIEGMYVRIQRDRCVMFDSGFGESDILIREQRQPNQYPAAVINQPTKIDAVYKAVVEFIKWYNSQNQ